MPLLPVDTADDARTERRFSPLTIPEQVAEELGSAIIDGRIKAGDRLIEADVAARFGISRGPVREAIRILERRRLLEMLPRRGAYVRAVSLASISDLFDVRRALALMAVRTFAAAPAENFIEMLSRCVSQMQTNIADGDPVAFAQITTRAVRAIARGSGNELLVELMKDLAEQTVWTTIWKSPLDYQTVAVREEATSTTQRVLKAVRNKNPDRAEDALRHLLEDNKDRAMAWFSSSQCKSG